MRTFILVFSLLFLISCSTNQKTTTTSRPEKVEVKIPEPKVYHAAYTRTNDLVHTKLEVKLDWTKKYLLGKATIALHPHFYATDSLVLNARGMDIHEVSLLRKDFSREKLSFSYDSLKIRIKLDREYKGEENYSVFIDYTSKPDELKEGGSRAITKDKGLYFVNADGSNPEKPKQVWTQGETESNSAWFPTIEDPQQKMTQEIYITVDTAMTTVSNGLLITSTKNNDGTKTDYWKQSLPTSPYLTMFTASNFAVVHDKWKNIEVNYYLDKEYEKYARMIFGHTPEMIDHYSKLLGVDYPWEKFSQVVVYDYVSGAMENTTAVIHGTNMLQDSSDYVDGNYEDYISHELFHHWFGDLVTCESWSNIVLNEGFANYAEYLWREYKFGRDDADRENQNEQSTYLLIAKSKDPDLIRFDYEGREDVYDAVSYNKGGRVLHMLRKYVGDEAFFASLKLYLETHQFGSAEVHDLRLAFEKITGEDLNWFFNEWFLNHGHPVIEIGYDWNDSSKTETVTIEQKQDFEKNPLYKIPLLVDVYHGGKTDRKKITIEKAKEVFSWQLASKPDLVNVDAERMLLCEKKDSKTQENYVFQYHHAPLFMDRYEAVSKTGSDYVANSASGKMIEDALSDKYWNIRLTALKNIGTQLTENKDRLKPKILALTKDEKSNVRVQAIKTVDKYFKDDEQAKTAYENGLKDISYNVQAASLKVISENNRAQALQLAKTMEASNGGDVLNAIAKLYTDSAKEEYNDFFLSSLDKMRGFARSQFAENYGKYLQKLDPSKWNAGIDKIAEAAARSRSYSHNSMVTTLENLSTNLFEKITAAKTKADDLRKNNAAQNEIDAADRESGQLTKQHELLKEKIKNLEKKN